MGGEQSDQRRAVEQRVRAGEWLRPGDAAVLLGVDRRTVDRMLRAGVMRYRVKPGTGRHREVHPEDLLREWATRRRVLGGEVSGTATTGQDPRNDENPAPGAGSGTS